MGASGSSEQPLHEEVILSWYAFLDTCPPGRGFRVFSHRDERLYEFSNIWFFLCTYLPSLSLLFRFDLSSSLLDFF